MIGTRSDQVPVHGHFGTAAYFDRLILQQLFLQAAASTGQTLDNKTIGAASKEAVATSSTININDDSVPWSVVTMTGNINPVIELSLGVSRSIWINPVTYTITWPGSITWRDDEIPELPASTWSLITATGTPVGGNTTAFAMYAGSLT